MIARVPAACALALVLTWPAPAAIQSGLAPAAAAAGDTPEVATAVREAFHAAYNLDHDEAVAHARRAVRLDPDSPRAQRSLASVLWLRILFQRGAVSVDHYLGSIGRSQKLLPKPDPQAAAEFTTAIDRALALATARLRANPRDLQAKYDAGAAYGLQASYVASVEGSLMSAFGIARRAFDAHEDVLRRDPSRVSAGVIVGTYRYIVSTFNLPTRIVAYIAGFGGGRAKGIALLEAAMRDPEARVDASAALMLIYSREGRHEDAMRLAHALGAEFPRNRLFTLEEGAAAIRAGQFGRADEVLTRGLAAFGRDARPKIPGEHAVWLYKRAAAHIGLDRRAEAAADLRDAFERGPTPWVRGRLQLEEGRLADLDGHRENALSAYRAARAACQTAGDTLCEDEAERLMRRPFARTPRAPGA